VSYHGSVLEPALPVGLGSPCTLINVPIDEQPWQLSAVFVPPTENGVPE
jgi:hypothetical protein